MTIFGLNFIDMLVILGIVAFAWFGWRQGFVASLFMFVGFIFGGVVGACLAPVLLGAINIHGTAGLLATCGIVLGLAVVGQVCTGMVGRELRDRITVEHIKVVDSLGGAALNICALAVIGWILASAASVLPASQVSAQVRSSSLLAALDKMVPMPARDMVGNIRKLVDDSGLPQLFDGFGVLPPTQVEAPSAAVVSNPAVQRALQSVVRVEGPAPSCNSGFTGSGFVVAQGRVLTNAHVVAGVPAPRVHVPGTRTVFHARTVYFDPRVDLAVLEVPGLTARVLKMAGAAQRGDEEVIAGYPGGGDMTATAARVRGTIGSGAARGTDIYGNPGVPREIYSLRGQARPGNSGGPLLTPSGTVAGVIFAQGQGDDQTAYALTSAQAAAAIAAGSTSTESVPTGGCVFD
ncbi:MAG: MarP family serine protease [Actinomycetes bacterium]